MIALMLRVLALIAALVVVSCSSAPRESGDAAVVAQLGDKAITMREVEERWRATAPSEFAEATFKLYEGRRKALDEIVASTLFAEAAKTSGLSPDAYVEAELAKRVPEVTDDEVASFYQTNISEMEGRPLTDVAPLITRFLSEQKRETARQALIAELRKSGPPLRVSLQAPRYPVEVADSDPVLGKPNAAVTIVEFSDFQCPYCLRASPTLRRLQEKYGDKVRVVWKDFPLTRIHPQAFKASEAAHCAGEQGKFWPYHDRLFANQGALQVDALKRYAQELSLEMGSFNSCLDSSKFAERVRRGLADGERLGVSSTPTMFINGRVLPGAYSYEDMAAIVDEELQKVE